MLSGSKIYVKEETKYSNIYLDIELYIISESWGIDSGKGFDSFILSKTEMSRGI